MLNKVTFDQTRIQVADLLRRYPELQDDEVLKADMLEGASNLNEVLEQLSAAMRDTDTMMEAQTQRIKDIQERRARYEARYESLREMIFDLMQTAELRKVELSEATLSIRSGSQSVMVTDQELIPLKFLKVAPPTVDKAALRDALKAGEQIAGASLSNGAPSLAVRVR